MKYARNNGTAGAASEFGALAVTTMNFPSGPQPVCLHSVGAINDGKHHGEFCALFIRAARKLGWRQDRRCKIGWRLAD